MAYKIHEIEGIGTAYASKLNMFGIKTTSDLLNAGNNRENRQQLAAKTGINERQLLDWINMADLFRIKGVSRQYSELLEASGVDSVKELRNRNSDNLAQTMQEVNAQKNLVRQTPSAKTVARWIEQARLLPPVITH